jgi:hypothetical protein
VEQQLNEKEKHQKKREPMRKKRKHREKEKETEKRESTEEDEVGESTASGMKKGSEENTSLSESGEEDGQVEREENDEELDRSLNLHSPSREEDVPLKKAKPPLKSWMMRRTKRDKGTSASGIEKNDSWDDGFYLLNNLQSRVWRIEIESELLFLVEKSYGKKDPVQWDHQREKIDEFWILKTPYGGNSLLRTDRNEYWKPISENEDSEIGTIALQLISAASSEAACERAFSQLRFILRRPRRGMHLKNVENSLILIKSW